MKAIRVYQSGGPEQLKLEEIERPQLGQGEVLVKIHAAGVNFIDIYHRTGLYPLPMPFTPGLEASGTVEAVGTDVDSVSVGDSVAYSAQLGAYAEYAVLPASALVPVPDGVSMTDAAAVMLQGMTAHYLAKSTFPLKQGDTALVHAAAGGVGLLLIQVAKKSGATVIGTVSTPEKAELATKAGADHVILYAQTDFAAETRRLTDGNGVDVVYDSVGVTTFEKSLTVLKPRGFMVLFGQSSGPVPPFNLAELNRHGSLYVTRPSLFHYIAKREDLLWRSGELFSWLKDGSLKVRIDRTLPLAEAAHAHELLAARKTAGKLLLLP